MADAITDLIEWQVKRKTYIKAVNRLRNQAEATVRLALGFDPNADEKEREKVKLRAKKIATAALNGKGCEIEGIEEDIETFGKAMKLLEEKRFAYELVMRKLARKLPVWGLFVEGVRGAGDLGLAVIVGEAGDLTKYGNPAKLWKRLGLAPVRSGDVTMACSNWRKKGGLSADEWIDAKYNPRRRAEIFSCVEDSLFQLQGKGEKALRYRKIYDARRAKTAVSHPDWTKEHSSKDARRIMVKQFLLDLWVKWRAATLDLKPGPLVPPEQSQTANTSLETSKPVPSEAADQSDNANHRRLVRRQPTPKAA